MTMSDVVCLFRVYGVHREPRLHYISWGDRWALRYDSDDTGVVSAANSETKERRCTISLPLLGGVYAIANREIDIDRFSH